MSYIIKVYADEQVYEYEYGLLEHAHEHLRQEQSYAEMYVNAWFHEQFPRYEAVGQTA